MNTEELILKLIETIENLAPQVWNILVKQAYAEAISNTIISMITLILFIVLIKVTIKCNEEFGNDDDEDSAWGYMLFAAVLGCFLCGGIFLYNSISAIMKFYNPEFYAIQLILEQIGG